MGYSVFSKYRAELMGAALLWVMLFHARGLEPGLPFLKMLRSAGFGGVDAFILLSSMGLVLSLQKREQDYSSFMARRAWRLLPAYFAVMVPYTLWGIARGSACLSTLFFNASLLYYWTRPRGAFNWYISGAMFFYALTPFCVRRLRRTGSRALRTAAGVVLSLLLCQILLRDGFWHYMDVFYRVPLFLLGLLLGFYVWEDRPLRTGDALFWGLSLAAGAAYLAFVLGTGYGFAPMAHLFLFTTVPMCLTGCLLFERLPLGWLRAALRLVGENSLEIYLLNVSFFSEPALLDGLANPGPIHWLYYLLMLALNLALGVLLHRGVEALKKRVQISPHSGKIN